MLALTVSSSLLQGTYRDFLICAKLCTRIWRNQEGPDKILTPKGSLTKGGGVGRSQLNLLIMSVLHPSNIYWGLPLTMDAHL